MTEDYSESWCTEGHSWAGRALCQSFIPWSVFSFSADLRDGCLVAWEELCLAEVKGSWEVQVYGIQILANVESRADRHLEKVSMINLLHDFINKTFEQCKASKHNLLQENIV